MGPYQRTPKEVATRYVLRFFRVRSVGPVGDFLDLEVSWSFYVSYHFPQKLLMSSGHWTYWARAMLRAKVMSLHLDMLQDHSVGWCDVHHLAIIPCGLAYSFQVWMDERCNATFFRRTFMKNICQFLSPKTCFFKTTHFFVGSTPDPVTVTTKIITLLGIPTNLYLQLLLGVWSVG